MLGEPWLFVMRLFQGHTSRLYQPLVDILLQLFMRMEMAILLASEMAILLASEMYILLPLQSSLKAPIFTLFSIIFTFISLTFRIYVFIRLSRACPIFRVHPLFLSFFSILLVSLYIISSKSCIGTTTLFFWLAVFSVSIDLSVVSYVDNNEFPYFISIEITSPDVSI